MRIRGYLVKKKTDVVLIELGIHARTPTYQVILLRLPRV